MDIHSYSAARELVASAKKTCDITKPNNEMTDDEIRVVILAIGSRLPDTTWTSDNMVLGRSGIQFLLFVTMSEFPEFYKKHYLQHYN